MGLTVIHLFRAAIGPISDSRLRAGEWRELEPTEVRALYEAAGVQVHTETMVASWVIAIDGPAGAGKTTVSQRVAELLNIPHLDTGAFYRVATLVALGASTDPTSASALEAISQAEFDFETGTTLLWGADVSEEIRGPEVTAAVSAVSAVPEVRTVMVDRQRDWVHDRDSRAVVEGRDIGTVVFPEARLKVFLTAREEVRAARRSREHPDLPEAGVAEELARRDHKDSSRAMSPLTAAHDAVVVDTSDLSFEEVVNAVMTLAQERGF